MNDNIEFVFKEDEDYIDQLVFISIWGVTKRIHLAAGIEDPEMNLGEIGTLRKLPKNIQLIIWDAVMKRMQKHLNDLLKEMNSEKGLDDCLVEFDKLFEKEN